MYHVLQTSARAITVVLPVLFLVALGVFLVSAFDLVMGKLASSMWVVRELGYGTSTFAEPTYVCLGAAGVMFVLAIISESNK